ncbi:hypothetical protein Tco_1140306 [Tanacetum coccineum]
MVRDKKRDPKKNKDPSMKELDELEDMINILEVTILIQFSMLNLDTSLDGFDFSDTDSCNESGDSRQNLINFMVGCDLDWQFPKQTQEIEEKTLDVAYPNKETGSSCRDTNSKCQAYYALRSLGPIREEDVVVKKPYNLVKVSNVVLGIKAPKNKLDVMVNPET